MKLSQFYLRLILVLLELTVGLSAIHGAYGLIFQNGLGMPLSLLENTPFNSYFWPGVILGVIVGGTSLTAAFLLVKEHKYMLEASAISGFGLLIWLFVEVGMILHTNTLSYIFFGLGIAILVLVMLLLKFDKLVK